MASADFLMPAEWERHQRCWIAWPCRESLWGSPAGMEKARAAYAAVARAIARFEPVTMIARPEHIAEAQKACGSGVSVQGHAIDDSWLRDTGPSFVRDAQGRLAGVAWRFNGWGGKYQPYDQDAAFAASLLQELGLPCLKAPLVAEGGALHVDGEGTLLTTRQCLLNANRNPGLDQAGAEQILREFLGVRKIIWLNEGLSGDETDGHVDNAVCFAAPGKVILQGCDDPGDANYTIAAENHSLLAGETDAAGRRFEIIRLPLPKPRFDAKGQRLTLSYVNYYLANGGIVLPSFGDPADGIAREIIAGAFPGRPIVQTPALDIVAGGGGIHCITQQMPEG